MGGVAGGCGGGRGLATGSTVVAPRRSTATATERPDPRVRLHLPTYLRCYKVAVFLRNATLHAQVDASRREGLEGSSGSPQS